MEVTQSICHDKTDIWLDLLEQNQMNNASYYSKALCISQRVRLKIEKLKTIKRKSQIHPGSSLPFSTTTTTTTKTSTISLIDDKPTLSCYSESNNTASDSEIATPCSPTSYKDKIDKGNDNNLLYISKALPLVNNSYNITLPAISGPPRCPLPALPLSDENQRLDSAVDLATALHEKDLPSIPSIPPLPSRKKDKTLPAPPRPPKISIVNNFNQNKQLSSSSSNAAYGVPILHVEKKRLGLKGLITRTYRLDSIIVTRNVFPNGLLMAKDCYTDRRMAVLQIMATTSNEESSFGFTFVWYTSKSKMFMTREQRNYDISHLVRVPDDRMQTALYLWIRRQNLPSLSLASQVFRRGLKLYVVYDTLLFQLK